MVVDLDQHLAAIAGGDPDAFGVWAAAAEPELRRVLRRFGAVADVEAVLQEALLRVWQVAPRLEGDGQANGLLRFCARTATHLALDMARRHRVDSSVIARLAEDLEEAFEPCDADPALAEAVRACRERLGGRPRQALDARLADGGAAPDSALAETLGMKPNTFAQNLARARRLMAHCLRARGVSLPGGVA